LAGARAVFLPFSAKAVDFAKHLRRQDDRFKSLKIYHCPMAPKPGLWLQLQGPLHNPFFGAEMPDCGEEVP
jgi:Cu(I)/Ag(I) efflux system membrane fusion protein